MPVNFGETEMEQQIVPETKVEHGFSNF